MNITRLDHGPFYTQARHTHIQFFETIKKQKKSFFFLDSQEVREGKRRERGNVFKLLSEHVLLCDIIFKFRPGVVQFHKNALGYFLVVRSGLQFQSKF